MHLWRTRKTQPGSSRKGVARAVAEGATQEELMREAIQILREAGGADRIGVWIELRGRSEKEDEYPLSFRGLVWDQGTEQAPSEWMRLSPEFPLPQELLSGKTVEQNLDGSGRSVLLGPLIEMHRALWVPIARGGRLRGVLLGATREKAGPLPKDLFESVAAELLLALELEEEQCIARQRRADLLLTRTTLKALESAASEDAILESILEDCMKKHIQDGGAGALFAAIGVPTSGTTVAPPGMSFPWKRGDPVWTKSLEVEPLFGMCRHAVEHRRVMGSEPPSSRLRAEVERVVALPLEAGGKVHGVLVAGLRGGSASLAGLERLELRAALASSVLLRENRNGEERRRLDWQRAILESSRTAVVFLTEQGRIAALSPAASELLEIPLEKNAPEQLHKNRGGNTFIAGEQELAALFAPHDQDRAAGLIRRISQQIRAGNSPVEDGSEFALPGGKRVSFGTVLPAAGGLVAVTFDSSKNEPVTGAERTEAELQNVLEWLEEGVLLFDANNGIRAMNNRFAQMAGLNHEEAAGFKSLDELIDRLKRGAAEPDNFAARWRELAHLSDGGVRDELQLARPIPRVLERAARPVLDASGRVLGRVEIYRDETAMRVFQAKLLQTEKLVALGQMVTGVAHELSNPLTSVMGYAQRLLLRRDPEVRREEVRQIYEEADRASTILRQLLLNARETRPERRSVSVNQIALRTMELRRSGLAAVKIRMEMDLDPALPFVYADPGQLQQVLVNLLENARQSIEESQKGGKIRVHTKQTAGGRVVLEVSDDGPGIPEAILARIFDPFFTTKPEGVGTGLGLAIVLGIVREHRGQIHVISPPGGGATFRIELPAAAGAQQLSEVASRTKEHAQRRPEQAREKRTLELPLVRTRSGEAATRVLVVEDEPIVARLIADVLEDEGMRVDVLLDGREALERAERERYDLVICDMKMPGLNGQNFYTTLARTGNPLRERFLFVTGDVVAAHTQQFLERHRLPHVAKPFRMEELTEKVRQVLQGEESGGALGTAEPAAGPAKKVARSG